MEKIRNKSTELTYKTVFRTKPAIAEAIKEMADEKFMSINSMINMILDAEIKKINKKKENIR